MVAHLYEALNIVHGEFSKASAHADILDYRGVSSARLTHVEGARLTENEDDATSGRCQL